MRTLDVGVGKVVAKDSLHPATFRGANRVFRRVPHAALEAVRHNKVGLQTEYKGPNKREGGS